MDYTLEYFNSGVQSGMDAWPVGIRASYLGITLRMQQHGPDLGMPYTRAMGGGLFEIRAKGQEGIGRAFFCTCVGKRIVILHGFIKKSRETPKKDLALARARLRRVQQHG